MSLGGVLGPSLPYGPSVYFLLTPSKKFSSLAKVDPQHHFLTDLEEKSDLFDKAASKYKAKVAA